jgi:hypothetical protein
MVSLIDVPINRIRLTRIAHRADCARLLLADAPGGHLRGEAAVASGRAHLSREDNITLRACRAVE